MIPTAKPSRHDYPTGQEVSVRCHCACGCRRNTMKLMVFDLSDEDAKALNKRNIPLLICGPCAWAHDVPESGHRIPWRD